MPKISIIVPVYKVEDCIGHCLNSIMVQTFLDWECILVDDGSPDRSGIICDEYAKKDSRFKVYHKINGGVSSARNVGLDNAKGIFVTFIDSDDFIDINFISSLIEPYLCDSEIDFIHGGCVDYLPLKKNVIPNQKYRNLVSTDKALLFAKFRGLIVSKLFNLEIIRENKIRFDERIKLGEDMVFTIDYLAYSSKYAFVESVGYFYVQREGSAMHTSVNYDYNSSLYSLKRRFSAIETYRELNNLSLNECRFRYEQTAYCFFITVYSLYGMSFSRCKRMQYLHNDLFPYYNRIIQYLPIQKRLLILPFKFRLMIFGDILLNFIFKLRNLGRERK